ncbi:MAG: sulfite exporter TauE/SafE family protein [Defluviitaleaceae bacterium]|nr:sulfite exporter TauE/SafE family protein [Defluviitaleaceae bacterium]
MSVVQILYFVIFLSSCVLGAIVGLGGGVIIRPILDVIDYHEVPDIAFLTSTAVLIMALVSTGKKVMDETKIDFKKAGLICLGSLIGGTLGDQLLRIPATHFGDNNVRIVQTMATIFFLGLAIFLTEKCTLRYEVKNKLFYPLLGIFLGSLAVFLGIGGGPINVPVFMILFSLPVKQATAYSIVVIFFSHLSRLITMGIEGRGYGSYDLSFLPYIIPAAIIGGIIGAIISRRVTDNAVRKTFTVTMCVLIAINIFNLVMFFRG